MSRIRTIKPELPQSESMGKVSRDARLLFIQLFTIVDDAGRARAASRLLASLLYPYDQDAAGLIDGWVMELEAVGCVRRYVVDGTTYLEIVKFKDHQRIDRPTPSRLPALCEASREPEKPREPTQIIARLPAPLASPREPSRAIDEPSTSPRSLSSISTRKGGEGKGEEHEERERADLTVGRHPPPQLEEVEAEKPKKVRSAAQHATRIPDDWKPTPDLVDYAKAQGLTDIQIARQAERFLNFWTAKSGKDATKTIPKGWAATWRNWVAKEAETSGTRPGTSLASANGISRAGGPKHLDVLPDGTVFVQADTPEWDLWAAHWRQHGGPNGARAAPPRYFHGGWHFPSRHPPGYEDAQRAAEAAMLKDPTS